AVAAVVTAAVESWLGCATRAAASTPSTKRPSSSPSSPPSREAPGSASTSATTSSNDTEERSPCKANQDAARPSAWSCRSNPMEGRHEQGQHPGGGRPGLDPALREQGAR